MKIDTNFFLIRSFKIDDWPTVPILAIRDANFFVVLGVACDAPTLTEPFLVRADLRVLGLRPSPFVVFLPTALRPAKRDFAALLLGVPAVNF